MRRELTVADLAAALGGRVAGDGARVLRRVASLDSAGPDVLAWFLSDRHKTALQASAAGAVLVGPDTPHLPGRTFVHVADPEVALCEALRLLAPPPERVPSGVHATAVVAADAVVEGAAIGPHVVIGRGSRVGAGTELHAGVFVGGEVTIGRDCVIWPNVVIRERVTIGDRVVIHANATIGADGFGYIRRQGRQVKIPQVGTVHIADDVEIGANAAIDRAKTGVTRIGRGTKIDNLVQIGHNCTIGEDCIIVAQCGVSGSTILGRGVVLAGQVGVIEHLRLDEGAMVMAQSGVTRNVPAGVVMRGSPAVEARAYARHEAAGRRLPEFIKQMRELTRRVARLESSADHRK